MGKTERRNRNNLAAAMRKAAKAERHAATMAAHAAHKAEFTIYAAAFDAWIESGQRGPRPIHPHGGC